METVFVLGMMAVFAVCLPRAVRVIGLMVFPVSIAEGLRMAMVAIKRTNKGS